MDKDEFCSFQYSLTNLNRFILNMIVVLLMPGFFTMVGNFPGSLNLLKINPSLKTLVQTYSLIINSITRSFNMVVKNQVDGKN